MIRYGDRVRVTDGFFKGLEGYVEDVNLQNYTVHFHLEDGTRVRNVLKEDVVLYVEEGQSDENSNEKEGGR